jgi:hypothetical protein
MSGIAAMTRKAVSMLLFLACNANAQEPDATPRLTSFEALGCSGDWSATSGRPTVWRLTKDRGVSFLVRHSAMCGLKGGKPRVSWNDRVPDLDYTMTSLVDGIVVMCECEYWAKFEFGDEALAIKRITFAGAEPELAGEWPK